jgi:hypothetical protein
VKVIHDPLFQPDLGSEPDCPFARDANNELIRRGFWLDRMTAVSPSR